jgi:hypothetical protein
MSDESHPVCDHCGERIHRYECIWRELTSGGVRSSYALDLQYITSRSPRVWHRACPPVNSHHLVAA